VGLRPGETERERLDRNLEQLLTEVRVAMPGVQILFGFLLAVPFTNRFAEATTFQRDVYLVTLVAAGLASALFIAPTAYHRILFRRGAKRHLVYTAGTWTIVGLVALAIAMNGAVLLVVDFLFETVVVIVLCTLLGGLYVSLWFVFPLYQRFTAGSAQRR
jgi:hypothetical protein